MTTVECFNDLDAYLGHFAGDMAERVSVGLEPMFNPETDPLSDEVMALQDCPEKQPYPAQAVAVEGLLRVLDQHPTAWLVGEMGTGKTPMALWLMRATVLKTIAEMEFKKGRAIRVVMTAPNQLVRKWKRHADSMLPGIKTRIVRNWKDLAPIREQSVTRRNGAKRWAKPTVSELWILPRDKGKLSYSWRAGVVSRPHTEVLEDDGQRVEIQTERFYCPKCGGVIVEGDEATPVERDYFVVKKGNKLKRRRSCVKCKEQLWQAHNGRPSPLDGGLPIPGIAPRRMAPCAYLRHLGINFDLYVSDEVHELKGEGTLQGQMFADLCGISEKVICLTGTLVGGYAENLLHLLWRTVPTRLIDDGLSHDSDGFASFVERYGVLQTTKRYVAKDGDTTRDLSLGRGKHVSTRTKSLPGISPLLFVHYLMDCAVFLRLQEMHAHLPPFDEKVHTIPPTEAQDQGLLLMQQAFEQHRKTHKPCRAWAAARACFLRWPDKPWIDSYTVYDADDNGTPIPAFNTPQLGMAEYPKERRIRRLVQRNMIRGRKTWIYTELAGMDGEPAWDWMAYLADYLGKFGIRAIILRSQAGGGPKPEDREAWIEQHGRTADVVISHPELVKTGLDLFQHPSIIFAFPGDKTYTLRQASRRAWRLGQMQPCEVDYVVYGGVISRSVQEASLSLMATKMAASLAIEGDFSSEGLAAMSSGEDMASQLAKFIDGKLDSLEPAKDAFTRYREKLEAAMPDIARDHKPKIETELPEAPPAPLPPVEVEPTVTPDPAPVADPRQANLDALRSLGVEVPEQEPDVKMRPAGGVGSGTKGRPKRVLSPAPAAETAKEFEHDTIGRAEPSSIRERKSLRLRALSSVLGNEPDESNGDLHRYGDRWYHLVAKRRATVRARNFAGDNGDTLIAFVEPAIEAGEMDGAPTTTVDGIDYVVGFMLVCSYRADARVPVCHAAALDTGF